MIIKYMCIYVDYIYTCLCIKLNIYIYIHLGINIPPPKVFQVYFWGTENTFSDVYGYATCIILRFTQLHPRFQDWVDSVRSPFAPVLVPIFGQHKELTQFFVTLPMQRTDTRTILDNYTNKSHGNFCCTVLGARVRYVS